MSNSFKEVLQMMSGEKTSVIQGVVTAVNPIRVSLVNDSVMDIPSSLIIVPEHLQKRQKSVKIMSMTGTTESGGSGNTSTGGGGTTYSGGSGSTDYGGNGQTGVCTIDGNEHFHYLGTHNHALGEHTHGIEPHHHTITSHTHDVRFQNETIQIEIDDSLQVGEYVHLLSIGEGKIYYILGRV